MVAHNFHFKVNVFLVIQKHKIYQVEIVLILQIFIILYQVIEQIVNVLLKQLLVIGQIIQIKNVIIEHFLLLEQE